MVADNATITCELKQEASSNSVCTIWGTAERLRDIL